MAVSISILRIDDAPEHAVLFPDEKSAKVARVAAATEHRVIVSWVAWHG